jgi:hypothetical protein
MNQKKTSPKLRQLKKDVQRVMPQNENDPPQLPRGSKTIRLPCDKQTYAEISKDPECFKAYLNEQLKKHPELFPKAMLENYVLDGYTASSSKLGIRLRRIKLKTGHVYVICPCFILPYMVGYTDDVEKALFLQRFGVPYWALTYAFGHDDMYWYRLVVSFGRNSIVGTTIKDPNKLPVDLVADEKHTTLAGEKSYIATTTGDDCILGAAMCMGAGIDDLTEGYSVFADEVKNMDSDYQPETVNTDGWNATGQAWLNAFSNITIIRCFLHAFIAIRDRSKRLGDLYNKIGDLVWDAYRAENKRTFSQRIRRLREWANHVLPPSPTLDKILSLCRKSHLFQKAYDHPNAHRTSNMVDRLMKNQDRYLFFMQYFHGHFYSAEMGIRAWAVLRNFQPYCPRAIENKSEMECAASRLNGFKYRDNWLENLLVSSSMCGYRQ